MVNDLPSITCYHRIEHSRAFGSAQENTILYDCISMTEERIASFASMKFSAASIGTYVSLLKSLIVSPRIGLLGEVRPLTLAHHYLEY